MYYWTIRVRYFGRAGARYTRLPRYVFRLTPGYQQIPRSVDKRFGRFRRFFTLELRPVPHLTVATVPTHSFARCRRGRRSSNPPFEIVASTVSENSCHLGRWAPPPRTRDGLTFRIVGCEQRRDRFQSIVGPRKSV